MPGFGFSSDDNNLSPRVLGTPGVLRELSYKGPLVRQSLSSPCNIPLRPMSGGAGMLSPPSEFGIACSSGMSSHLRPPSQGTLGSGSLLNLRRVSVRSKPPKP